MSIKVPDMQVLLGRTDQVPKVLREGDPHGAGKLAPQVMADFAEKTKKITTTPENANIRREKEKNKNKEKEKEKGKQEGHSKQRRHRDNTGGNIDVLA